MISTDFIQDIRSQIAQALKTCREQLIDKPDFTKLREAFLAKRRVQLLEDLGRNLDNHDKNRVHDFIRDIQSAIVSDFDRLEPDQLTVGHEILFDLAESVFVRKFEHANRYHPGDIAEEAEQLVFFREMRSSLARTSLTRIFEEVDAIRSGTGKYTPSALRDLGHSSVKADPRLEEWARISRSLAQINGLKDQGYPVTQEAGRLNTAKWHAILGALS